MRGAMKVAVILLNWNGLADTLECLESLAGQSRPADFIYVVDNNSANDEARTIQARFPSAIVLPQSTNTGFCGGNNIGIKRALADGAARLLILNNDTVMPPSLIADLFGAFDSIPNAGAISPVITRPDGAIWFAGAKWEPHTAGFRHILSGEPRAALTATEPFESPYACGCCLFTSAEIVNRVGLMDERYFAYYDEADWCSRMARAGFKSFVIPSTTLIHKVSGSTPGPISRYLMARNRLLWMRDHLPIKELIKSAPYLMRELAWCFRNYSDPLSQILRRANLDFLRGRLGAWPQALPKEL
jgi:GT2 family glycosyltransferase